MHACKLQHLKGVRAKGFTKRYMEDPQARVMVFAPLKSLIVRNSYREHMDKLLDHDCIF